MCMWFSIALEWPESLLILLFLWPGRLGVVVGGTKFRGQKATQTVVLILREGGPVEQAERLGAGNIQDGNSLKTFIFGVLFSWAMGIVIRRTQL